ncbi:hypothetical protein [Paracoccus cavernae]
MGVVEIVLDEKLMDKETLEAALASSLVLGKAA